MRKRGLIFGVFLVISILYIAGASAADFTYVISNSDNWRDVYSSVHYANLKGVGSDFIVGPKHGPSLIAGIGKDNFIRVISSKKSAFAFNFVDTIKNAGFKGADELSVNSANLELINDLPDVTHFIVVGNTYGYNAIAVAPYAVLTKSWVFFADRTNMGEIDAILSRRKIDSLIIYGIVDREVKTLLDKYKPDVIDNSDRFKDDVEIVKRYIKVKPVNQVVLTNGEFIEKEIMAGAEPVLFTGKDNVPDQIGSYLTNSEIKVGVLVGSDLVGAATNIRRSTGISVIVKFARGARSPGGSIAAVEGIDIFYIPSPTMKLDIASAKFNNANSQLEITYRSDSNVPVFFKGSVDLQNDQGERTRIGDVDPIFIGPNNYKTIIYPNIGIKGENLNASIVTFYGETPTSLEKILEKTLHVELVNIIDNCQVVIKGVKYNKPKKAFYVDLENTGKFDCWAEVEINDISIDGIKKTLPSGGSQKIGAGKSGEVSIKQEMTDDDLQNNPFVDVSAYFGEKEDSLLKLVRGKFELKIETISYATIALSAAAILVTIIIIIILFIFFKRRKDKDDWN